MSPIKQPTFPCDDVNLIHLGSNFYALLFPRRVRVVLATVNALRERLGISQPTEFKKEGLRRRGTERIGSSREMVRFPAIPAALRIRGVDPMDYVLIRFGPRQDEVQG